MNHQNTTYLDWLKSQVEYYTERGQHDFLFKRLYEREYYAVIDKDINRIYDGVSLRQGYIDSCAMSPSFDEEAASDEPCRFLEFLIALATRMSFIMSDIDEDLTEDCFWELLHNMGNLDKLNDQEYLSLGGDMAVDMAIDRVLERNYAASGVGGLFPMNNPRCDQRNVEIWYQMNQYLNEKRKGY